MTDSRWCFCDKSIALPFVFSGAKVQERLLCSATPTGAFNNQFCYWGGTLLFDLEGWGNLVSIYWKTMSTFSKIQYALRFEFFSLHACTSPCFSFIVEGGWKESFLFMQFEMKVVCLLPNYNVASELIPMALKWLDY